MIRHVTRFTEEIFALIIALIYLYEPFKKLYKVNAPSRISLLDSLLDLSSQSRSIDLQLRLSVNVCL